MPRPARSGYPDRCAGGRHDAAPHLQLGEAAIRRGNHDIRGQHQFNADREANALNRGDQRFCTQPAQIDRIDLLNGEKRFAFGEALGKFAQFQAGREVLAFGTQQPATKRGSRSIAENAALNSSSMTALKPLSFLGRSMTIRARRLAVASRSGHRRDLGRRSSYPPINVVSETVGGHRRVRFAGNNIVSTSGRAYGSSRNLLDSILRPFGKRRS